MEIFQREYIAVLSHLLDHEQLLIRFKHLECTRNNGEEVFSKNANQPRHTFRASRTGPWDTQAFFLIQRDYNISVTFNGNTNKASLQLCRYIAPEPEWFPPKILYRKSGTWENQGEFILSNYGYIEQPSPRVLEYKVLTGDASKLGTPATKESGEVYLPYITQDVDMGWFYWGDVWLWSAQSNMTWKKVMDPRRIVNGRLEPLVSEFPKRLDSFGFFFDEGKGTFNISQTVAPVLLWQHLNDLVLSDFRVARSDGNVYPEIWMTFLNKYAPLMCTRDFRNTVSNICHETFLRQVHLYHPDHWCGIYAQDRNFVTNQLQNGQGMEDMYNLCVFQDGRQMLATDDLCRDGKYAADLMAYTNLWSHTERYETIIRNKCAITKNTERCLLNSDSTERRLCGCFLPQNVMDRAAVLKAGYADSNVRCWYPPCQSDRTVKTRDMIDTVCPNNNIAICDVSVQLTAGGDIANHGELGAECGIVFDV